MTSGNPWPGAMMDHALELVARGYSPREIGKRLDPPKSRNAVLGKLWRLSETKVKRAERNQQRREAKARKELDQTIAARHEAELLVEYYTQEVGSRCCVSLAWPGTPDCHNTRQPGDRHGLCAEHRRGLMPERKWVGISPVMGPAGW